MTIRERGIGNVAFVFVLVLFVVAVLMWFLGNDDNKKYVARLKEYEAQNAQLALRTSQWQGAYEQLAQVMGYPALARTGEEPPKDIAKTARDMLWKAAQDTAASSEVSLPSKRYQVPSGGDKVQVTPGEPQVLRLYGAAATPDTITVQNLLEPTPAQFAFAVKVIKEAVENLNKGLEGADQRVTALQSESTKASDDYKKDVAQKQSDYDSAKQQAAAAQDSLQSLTARFDQINTELGNVKGAAEKSVRSAQIETESWRSAFRNEKSKNALAIAEDPKDGEVLEVGDTSGNVFLNLGRKNKVSADTRFTIWRPGKGNVREDIAVVRVIKVEDSMCEARIEKVIRSRVPLTRGMYASNPFFDARRSIRVHVWGDLKTYPSDVAKRRLVNAGCTIVEGLDDTVNVIILGEPPVQMAASADEGEAAAAEKQAGADRARMLDEVMKKAAAIGALVVTEDVLRTFIDY